MRSSQFFISTLKEAPSEAELPSHKLMLRAGLITNSRARMTPKRGLISSRNLVCIW